MSQWLLVISNFPDDAAARHAARALVEAGLAACVNILAPCHSVYRWEGKLEEASEVPLLIKTHAARYPELETAIKALHSYTVPEIIAIPITGGSTDYLDWISRETRAPLQA
jgi:periplasmic divalent cation tolerance protein